MESASIRRMREFGPDVVHFHNLVTGIGLTELRAARDTGAKVFSHRTRAGLDSSVSAEH